MSIALRKLVVSDIHGRRLALDKVLEAAEVDMSKDKLHFLGDYIDRGPASANVIATVRKYEEQGAVVLKGNHEDMHLLWLMEKMDESDYFRNGGEETLNSFQHAYNDEQYREALEWMVKLPTIYEDEEFVYVHAGIHPYKQKSEAGDHLWIREDFLFAKGEDILERTGGRKVVHGHTPASKVRDDGARINIDLGAGSLGGLSLTDLTNGMYYKYNFHTKRVHEYRIQEVDRKPW